MPAGWNSSTTLPEGSSSRICEPPGPVTTSLRKRQPGLAELGDLGVDVVDDEVDAVPAAGARLLPVGHRSSGGARRTAEQQPQVAAGDVGERGGGAGAHLEAEVLRVEVDRRLDVVDHVADVHHLVVFRHGSSCGVVGAGSDRFGESGEQEPDAGLQLGGRLLEGRRSWPRRRRRHRRRGRGCSSGSVSGWPGNSGQTSRTRSHRLITRSKRCSANTLEVLRALPGQVDAVLVSHHPHGVGVQRLGVAAGAVRLDPSAGAGPGQRFGHLGAGAVARAQEQHPRPSSVPAATVSAAAGRGAARGAAPRPWRPGASGRGRGRRV